MVSFMKWLKLDLLVNVFHCQETVDHVGVVIVLLVFFLLDCYYVGKRLQCVEGVVVQFPHLRRLGLFAFYYVQFADYISQIGFCVFETF